MVCKIDCEAEVAALKADLESVRASYTLTYDDALKQYHLAERYRKALELLGDHHPQCQCFCMDHRAIARTALGDKDRGEK